MSLYARWIEGWERRLTLRDPYRRMLPFSWGLEWVDGQVAEGGGIADPREHFLKLSDRLVGDSEDYFARPLANDFRLAGDDRLTFATPTPGPLECNNTASARLFESAGSTAGVVVVPQWNSDPTGHVGLCRMLKRLGLTTLRMTLPFHEERRPPGMQRADYMVSPNIGRTLHATRQAVLEVRAAVRWLRERGCRKVGVMGTSIGSCVTYLAFVHDPDIATGVFNHVSSHFGDVVWRGLSTRYVRWGLEGFIQPEQLQRCWAPVSPYCFVHRLKDAPRRHLLITARYDPTFPFDLTRRVFERYRELDLPLERIVLPCGHYTLAHFPFKYIDGWHICRYLRKRLL